MNNEKEQPTKHIQDFQSATYLYVNAPDDGRKYWFPMRVTYGRSAIVAKELRLLNLPDVEFFLPSEERVVYKRGNRLYYINKERQRVKGNVDDEDDSTKVWISPMSLIRKVQDINEAVTSIPRKYSKLSQVESSCLYEVASVGNLIFVHGTKSDIIGLKKLGEPFSWMHFSTYRDDSMMTPDMNVYMIRSITKAIVVPAYQMENFMATLKHHKGRVTIVEYKDAYKYCGKDIEFVDGPLKGRTAKLRRVGKDQSRQVHVDIPGVMVAQIKFDKNLRFRVLEQ